MIKFIKSRIFSFLLGISIASVTGLYLHIHDKALLSDLVSRVSEKREGGFNLISPLLECAQDETSFKELTPFKQRVIDLINGYKKELKISEVSVYFRDMNNGPWFGINERAQFSPASLLKVPVMISYLKNAEHDPGILNKKYTYKSKEPIAPNLFIDIPDEYKLEDGKEYTVEELIEAMITISDNNASSILSLNTDPFLLNNFFLKLGLTIADSEENFMTTKDYASFFRILYNASYLDKDMSEKALSLMTPKLFKYGIVNTVPLEIPVASKFGIRLISENEKQFHDCDIVYYPGHPYSLCIMTRGDDWENMVMVLQNISLLVYKEIDSQFNR